MLVSGVKKIFLSQMAKFRAEVARDFQMVVDDEADVRAARDGQDFFRHARGFRRARNFWRAVGSNRCRRRRVVARRVRARGHANRPCPQRCKAWQSASGFIFTTKYTNHTKRTPKKIRFRRFSPGTCTDLHWSAGLPPAFRGRNTQGRSQTGAPPGRRFNPAMNYSDFKSWWFPQIKTAAGFLPPPRAFAKVTSNRRHSRISREIVPASS